LFILFSIIYVIGGVVYIIFGSAVPREWATHEAKTKVLNTGKKRTEETIPLQQPRNPLVTTGIMSHDQ